MEQYEPYAAWEEGKKGEQQGCEQLCVRLWCGVHSGCGVDGVCGGVRGSERGGGGVCSGCGVDGVCGGVHGNEGGGCAPNAAPT